jgi:hypothetical protein
MSRGKKRNDPATRFFAINGMAELHSRFASKVLFSDIHIDDR